MLDLWEFRGGGEGLVASVEYECACCCEGCETA